MAKHNILLTTEQRDIRNKLIAVINQQAAKCKLERGTLYADKRLSDYPGNIFGRQIKAHVYSLKTKSLKKRMKKSVKLCKKVSAAYAADAELKGFKLIIPKNCGRYGRGDHSYVQVHRVE